MFPVSSHVSSTTPGLQATLAAASADGNLPHIHPHHPIVCNGILLYEEDGTFGCNHVKVPPGDARTQKALIHSIACLIIEEASKL